jgi:hypothetical protein
MDDMRYEWTLKNAATYDVRPLFHGPEAAILLRSAGRAATRRDIATRAWQHIVPDDLSSLTQVASFDSGCLTVAVTSAPARYWLHQHTEQLRQALCRVLPILHKLRFTAGLGSNSQDEDPAGG